VILLSFHPFFDGYRDNVATPLRIQRQTSRKRSSMTFSTAFQRHGAGIGKGSRLGSGQPGLPRTTEPAPAPSLGLLVPTGVPVRFAAHRYSR
jgi:hypothetical protein